MIRGCIPAVRDVNLKIDSREIPYQIKENFTKYLLQTVWVSLLRKGIVSC